MKIAPFKIVSFNSVIPKFRTKSGGAILSYEDFTNKIMISIINTKWNHNIVKKYYFVQYFLQPVSFIFLKNYINWLNVSDNLSTKSNIHFNLLSKEFFNFSHQQKKIFLSENKFINVLFNVLNFENSGNKNIFKNKGRIFEKLFSLQLLQNTIFPIQRYAIQNRYKLQSLSILKNIPLHENISSMQLSQRFIHTMYYNSMKNQIRRQELREKTINMDSDVKSSNLTKSKSSDVDYKANFKFSPKTLHANPDLSPKIQKKVTPKTTHFSHFNHIVQDIIGFTYLYRVNKSLENINDIRTIMQLNKSKGYIVNKDLPKVSLQATQTSYGFKKNEILPSNFEFVPKDNMQTRQKKKQFSVAGYNKQNVDLTHSLPVTQMANFPRKETSQLQSSEASGNKSIQNNQKLVKETVEQVSLSSPVIYKIADQVSDIMERKFRLERERREIFI